MPPGDYPIITHFKVSFRIVSHFEKPFEKDYSEHLSSKPLSRRLTADVSFIHVSSRLKPKNLTRKNGEDAHVDSRKVLNDFSLQSSDEMSSTN